MADRVCLALGRSLSSPGYTADRARQAWGASLGVQVCSSAEAITTAGLQWHLRTALTRLVARADRRHAVTNVLAGGT